MKVKNLLFFILMLFTSSLMRAQSVVDIIVNSPDHNTLEAAVIAAELVDVLNGEGPFTVFAPTDAAFDALPEGTLDALLNDIPALTAVLTYHVVAADARSTDLSDGQLITTLNGSDVTVTINADGVFINNAQVTVADLVADNGVVHVIDAVLLPPAASNTVVDIIVNSPDHNTLEASVVAAGLVDALNGEGPFTVFAPTDAAFDALPEGTLDALLNDIPALTAVLTYHVVGADARSTDLSDGQVITTLNGSDVTVTINADGVFINNAQVTVANLVADNGVVHVIDVVLLPPAVSNTVVDIIVNSPDHNTLEAAVVAAGLVDALNGEGPFTVFAPTDAAFDALPEGTLDALLNDIPALTAVLTYHVVAADARSTDLSDGQVITTLNGSDVTVTINADGVFINNAQVTVADLVADNGVVHVIDAVLLPPAASNTVVDIIVNSPDHNTLEAAVVAAELVDALNGEGPFTVFAPTDAAFDALPEGTVDALLADPQGELANILLYHVATSIENPQSPFTDGQKIITLSNGKSLTVTVNNEGIFINDAQITVGWLLASNGVVHVIDAVLLPTFTVADIITNSAAHTTLTAALNVAGLTSTLQEDGSFTVFAPTDAAFDALPEGTLDALLSDIPTLTDILLYHAIDDEIFSEDIENFGTGYPLTLNNKTLTVRFDDGNIFVNDVLIVIEDIEADNGVVHVINSVLLAPDSTIVDVVRNSPNHTILESLLDLSEFSGPLSGYGPFTLFAPTDAAISALSPAVIAELNNDPSLLESVLLYHVLGSNTVSGDLSNGLEAITLLGKTVKVTINNEGVFINDAMVTVADILTDNGVVHVIDAVLLPPYTVNNLISENENLFDLSFLLFVTGLSQTLDSSGPFTVFAPNDNAFDNMSQDLIDFTNSDPNGLSDLLSYHVANGLFLSVLLENGQSIATLNGNTVIVTITNGRVFVNSAEVIETDLLADNGVVHIIDQVLDTRTSIFDVVKEKIQIYPNPSVDMIKIKDLEIGEYKYFITDMNNKIISTGNLNSNNTLDVRDLSNGSYILLLQNNNKVSATTFVKVN